MQKQYAQLVKTFFQNYGLRRREWAALVAQWAEQGKNKELRARIEALMAQIEEHHTALNALLVQPDANTDRIERLYTQMRGSFSELENITKPVWREWVEHIVFAAAAAFVIRTFIFGIYHVPTGSAEPNILVGDRLWGNKFVYFVHKPKHGDLVIFNDPEFAYSPSRLKRLWQEYVGLGLFGLAPVGPENWVKRVIAVPGDTIEGRVEGGKTVIYRNGEKLYEPYINPYPLIRMRKESGFFDRDTFMGRLVPPFLRKRTREVNYTYDPTVPFDAQPFYHITEDEIIRDYRTGELSLAWPRDPWFIPYLRRNVDTFGPFVVPAGKYWVQGDSRRNSRDSRFWTFLDEKFVLGRASFVIFSLDSEESFWGFSLLKDPVAFFTRIIRYNRLLKPLWGIPNLREGLPSELRDKIE